MDTLTNRAGWNGVGSHPDYLAHTRRDFKDPATQPAQSVTDVSDPVIVALEQISNAHAEMIDVHAKQHAELLDQQAKQHGELMAAVTRLVQLSGPKVDTVVPPPVVPAAPKT